MVSLWFSCVICTDRSRYLVCIYSKMLINILDLVVDWLQCQHFHLSDSKPIPLFKFIIYNFLILLYHCQSFGMLYVSLWLRFCSLVDNSFIWPREMKTSEWSRCRKIKNQHKIKKRGKNSSFLQVLNHTTKVFKISRQVTSRFKRVSY